MSRLIRLAPEDNVAVAASTSAPAEQLLLDGLTLTSRSAIPFAHKIALVAIPADAVVIKYGVPIGRASGPIAAGEHVHVHNIRSDYVNNQVDFYDAPATAAGGEP